MTKLPTAQAGFSLLEVMIAITLFAVFISAFLVSQGYNVSDSALTEEQLKLHMLCEKKMNELMIDPPRFTNALEDLKETKTFEEKDFANYSWTVEWKRLKVPDFGKIFAANAQAGGAGEDNKYYDTDNSASRNQTLEAVVFEKLKENIERAVWQLRLTVTNKETQYSYTLSRWVTNYDEPIQLNLSL
ncbi:MAG: prepilin-type N-terminal cleavage/methylation domain-containing protein [Bacteriovoracia bacterium]